MLLVVLGLGLMGISFYAMGQSSGSQTATATITNGTTTVVTTIIYTGGLGNTATSTYTVTQTVVTTTSASATSCGAQSCVTLSVTSDVRTRYGTVVNQNDVVTVAGTLSCGAVNLQAATGANGIATFTVPNCSGTLTATENLYHVSETFSWPTTTNLELSYVVYLSIVPVTDNPLGIGLSTAQLFALVGVSMFALGLVGSVFTKELAGSA